MDIYQVIRLRKAVRSYQDRQVDREVLERVLGAARLAPSARNMQEWRFVVATERETREALKQAANNQSFVGEAPVVIAGCALKSDHVMRCGQPSYPIDVAIATDHLVLAAAAEGLGTCWIGAFDEAEVRRILHIPSEVRVVELLTLGYPTDPAPVDKNRLSLKEIVRWERWT
jgi:nitroreductase